MGGHLSSASVSTVQQEQSYVYNQKIIEMICAYTSVIVPVP